eukprot:1196308-Prorocentrum_minimum.AAC.6
MGRDSLGTTSAALPRVAALEWSEAFFLPTTTPTLQPSAGAVRSGDVVAAGATNLLSILLNLINILKGRTH